MENKDAVQFVDPEVTKIKFQQELLAFKQLEDLYRKKGVLCIKTEPLSITLLFAIPHLTPQPIAFTVQIDYSNWDVEPPSIKFVDPFLDKILKREDIKIFFFQKNDNEISINSQGQFNGQDLLQGNNEIPAFFCIPGVFEYHNHPAHSGDPWMLHRTMGEGKLCVLIDQLYKHSIAQSAGYQVGLEIKATVTGILPDINKIIQ